MPLARRSLHRSGRAELPHPAPTVPPGCLTYSLDAFDLDVRWFQIAVDDPGFMRGFQGFGDLLGDGQGFV